MNTSEGKQVGSEEHEYSYSEIAALIRHQHHKRGAAFEQATANDRQKAINDFVSGMAEQLSALSFALTSDKGGRRFSHESSTNIASYLIGVAVGLLRFPHSSLGEAFKELEGDRPFHISLSCMFSYFCPTGCHVGSRDDPQFG
jgi:hypothetical protein